jgi:hypothetical protein
MPSPRLAARALLEDARFALRMLRTRPLFTLTAVLALGLGIGASSAILGVVDAVLVRPLAYADADRLVVLLHGGDSPVAGANVVDWRREARSFARINAAELWGPSLTGDGRPEKVRGMRVTTDMFAMLGVPPLLGRALRPGADVDPADVHDVVLSHAFWKARFGGDPSVIGRTMILDGVSHVVVGVMPPSFRFAPFWATGT